MWELLTQTAKKVDKGLTLIDALADVESADENNLFAYNPTEKKKIVVPATESTLVSKIKPNYENLEREHTLNTQQVRKEVPVPSAAVPKPVLEIGAIPESSEPSLAENVANIAFNSREVRLVGPQRRPVEMKDDIPSKMVVVLENLQKEAKDVWGDIKPKLERGWEDVSGQLEKGWGDIKTMVEGVITPASKKQGNRSL